jgi:two-component system phosphate regulon response regulator PhoB
MNDSIDDMNRILVIEDDPDTQEMLCDILSDAGYNPLSAPDGEQGLELAENAQPGLILLDLMLPGMDGLEVCRQLSSSDVTRSIPVIILTARQELPVKLSSFMAGAKRFLTKPFETDVLLSEISRTFRQASLGDSRHFDGANLDPRD